MAEKRPVYKKEIVEIGQSKGMRFKLKSGAVFSFILPNGKEEKWESVHMSDKPMVLVAGLTDKKKLVLVRMFRFPVEDWTCELPGGSVEDGEDFPTAAKREFLEETGYAVADALQFQELCRNGTKLKISLGCRWLKKVRLK